MTDPNSLLIVEAAGLLSAAGIGLWNPDGAYPPNPDRPVIIDSVMPASPDSVIVLTVYPVSAGAGDEDDVIGLQVRTRAAGARPDTVRAIDRAVFEVLHNRRGSIGSVPVTRCLAQSSASLGQDSSKRWEWSTNYYVTLPRATPHYH